MTLPAIEPGPIDSGPMAPGYGTAYYNLVKEIRPRYGLEIGTETGLSAANWLLATPYGQLTSVDIAPCEMAAARIQNLGDTVWERWRFVQADSRGFLAGVLGRYDWLYVDGDHSYLGCLTDLVLGWGALAPGGVMVVDDYGIDGIGVRDACIAFSSGLSPKWAELPGHPYGAIWTRKPEL